MLALIGTATLGGVGGCFSNNDEQTGGHGTDTPTVSTETKGVDTSDGTDTTEATDTNPQQCTFPSVDPMTYRSVAPQPEPAVLPPAYQLRTVRPAAAFERVGDSSAYARFHDRDVPEFPTIEPCDIQLGLSAPNSTAIYGTFDAAAVADAMKTDEAQRLDDRHGFERFFFREFSPRMVAIGDEFVLEVVRSVNSNAVHHLNHQIDVFAGEAEPYADQSPLRTIESVVPQGVFTSLEAGEVITSMPSGNGDQLDAVGQTAQFADDGLDLRSVFLFDETASDLREQVKEATSGYGYGRKIYRFPVNSPTITRDGRLMIVDDHTTFEELF